MLFQGHCIVKVVWLVALRIGAGPPCTHTALLLSEKKVQLSRQKYGPSARAASSARSSAKSLWCGKSTQAQYGRWQQVTMIASRWFVLNHLLHLDVLRLSDAHALAGNTAP